MGAPRSGSTVLGTVLAERGEGFHVGELHLLWDRLATQRLCGCGLEVRACPFWAEVWGQVRGTAGIDSPEEACSLWSDVVRIRRAFTGGDDSGSQRFRELMDATYSSIAAVADVPLVVDTSKHPGYFRVLAGAATPISLIQLTRDPRALAYSWSKPKPDPDQPTGAMAVRRPAVVAAEWVGLNLLAGLTGRRFEGFRRIRYESMVVDGVDTMIPESAGGKAPSGRAHRPTADIDDIWNHTVAGNPLRMGDGGNELKLDTRWVTGLRPADRMVVTTLTAPLLVSYGYRPKDRRR